MDVAKTRSGECIIRHLYLGLEKGEVKAVSGLMLHGRKNICEILAGYKIPSDGKLWAMSTWEVRSHPHKVCNFFFQRNNIFLRKLEQLI